MSESAKQQPHFLYPDWPVPKQVNAVMTTRQGGVSQAPFDSMNLGTHVDDAADHVTQNRAILKQSLALPAEPLWLNQVHGIHIVEHAETQSIVDADAVISRNPNEVCAIMTADCLPVLFADTKGTVVAAAHAGWRGLQSGILEQCVLKMQVPSHETIVWLGAAIGPEKFEVGTEVKEAFGAVYQESEAAFKQSNQSEGKWLADIYELAKIHLTQCGVPLENIFGGGHCTHTESTRFFSYRREARTGRMASLIWLSE